MATFIARPNSNITKSWNISDYTYIDDVVTQPTIGGTSDNNFANKNDDDEVEEYGVDISALPNGSLITRFDTWSLAKYHNTYEPDPGGSVTLSTQYRWEGGSASSQKSSSVVGSNPEAYVWVSDPWTGLSLYKTSSSTLAYMPAPSGLTSRKQLYLAVAYIFVTYTPVVMNMQGGNYSGGNYGVG